VTTTAPTRSPHLKSPTVPADRPSLAGQAPAPAASSAPKVVAEGALPAVGSDPHLAAERNRAS
jgi:hypothetical protein